MSVETLDYECADCKLSGSNLSLGRPRYYVNFDAEVLMSVQMGYCFMGQHISAMERFPEAAEISELEAALVAARTQFAEEQRLAERNKRWWQTKVRLTDRASIISHDIASATKRLQRLRILSALLSQRVSGPRCLQCYSDQCVPLPKVPPELGYGLLDTRPILLGFRHPQCGGELSVREGIRFSMNWKPQYFDREGRPLE